MLWEEDGDLNDIHTWKTALLALPAHHLPLPPAFACPNFISLHLSSHFMHTTMEEWRGLGDSCLCFPTLAMRTLLLYFCNHTWAGRAWLFRPPAALL